MQLVSGKSPTFPGFSDCTPSSIELEGNNEYLKILRRIDEARKCSRQVDCDQRIKIALKSRINTSVERTYLYGDPIWFKLDKSNKWKSGTVLAQDGKVLFIRYGNFIRRIPLDRVVPAEEVHEDDDNDDAKEQDEENDARLLDDNFENVEMVVQKEKEIEKLLKIIQDKNDHIQKLETKSLPPQTNVVLPKQFQKVKVKLLGKDEILVGKVVRKHKKKSTSRNIIGMQLNDGTDRDIDFSHDIEYWKDMDHLDEGMEEIETFATVLSKAEASKRPDFKKSMSDEIKKFKDFGAFTKVKDNGQYAIKTRWVFSEKDETKGDDIKARLCMRGDKEEHVDSIRADSPTANKDSLKLALAIAANEGFDIISGDIKSAFLQGQTLDRNVLVVPPSEAEDGGMLWKLEKAAYGLIDGSRLFYLELKKKLESLGLKVVSGDPALFTLHIDKELVGIVCVHVDDLFMAGNQLFKPVLIQGLAKKFKFSKIEENKFKYLGCRIQKLVNGDITLDQNEYIETVEKVSVPPKRNSSLVNEEERKEIRRVVGELLWVSLMTRPDISFEVNKLSSNISKATIKDLKDARRLVEKTKEDPVTLNFTRLGPKDDLKIRLFCDASFNNQDEKLRSTEGRVILLENRKSNKSNLFSWKTKKISRICRSVKAAETRALENGLDEAVHFARMVREIYDGEVDLKEPKQVDVEALTDNKGLWENLHNSRQCEEKLLRNSIALIKEMIDRRETKKIDWVDTSHMLADILTKQGGNGAWIKNVVSHNVV